MYRRTQLDYRFSRLFILSFDGRFQSESKGRSLSIVKCVTSHTRAYNFNDRQIVLLIMRFPDNQQPYYLAHTTHAHRHTHAQRRHACIALTDKVDSTVNDDRCRRHFHDTKYEK